LANQTFPLLKRRLKELDPKTRAEGERVLELEGTLRRRLREVEQKKIRAMRLRCHGDFHLGQVLHTGKDFVILDFEGEPARPLSERRLKRSPLRDVAGMLRSFHYAAYTALFEQEAQGQISPDRLSLLEPAARLWNAWVGATYLRAYLERAEGADFIPSSGEATGTLLNALLLEKGIYELGYELDNRPSWVRIPLKGLLHLLGGDAPE
jgi:maltose alpha-D-glucosyltransferase/alpha-amylase